MPATPADISRFTNDGVVISSAAAAATTIKALHPDARDLGEREIEMFYDSELDAQGVLDERFSYLSLTDPAHIGAEVEDRLELGEDVPIAPRVPCWNLIDEERGIATIARTRAYAYDSNSDRYSIELLQ